MKFGKQILAQQISGWGEYYLDYKFLKKIINSLEKGRLGDAALFATGVRPSLPAGIPDSGEHASQTSGPADENADAQIAHAHAHANAQDAAAAAAGLTSDSKAQELHIHKAAFFFKLQRELEKINAFYLQKEDQLKTRLRTLIEKRKYLLAAPSYRKEEGRDAAEGQSHRGENAKTAVARRVLPVSKDSPSYIALYEGFRYFEKDLGKLQQFIEVNATGFRKILKKWDKRSKSQTKELYLARQVEVQPCFNREFIARLSDIATANLQELENYSYDASSGHSLPNSGAAGPGSRPNGAGHSAAELELDLDHDGDMEELDLDMGADLSLEEQGAARRVGRYDALSDLEANLRASITSGRVDAAKDMLRVAREDFGLSSPHSKSAVPTSLSRIIWRALLEAPKEAADAALKAELADFSFVDDINGRTCLHEAARAGNLRLLDACVSEGVDVKRKDAYGRAALSYAAMAGHAIVCTYLLEHAPVDATWSDYQDNDGFSPLLLAVINGRAGIVQILLSHGVRVETSSSLDPLSIAAAGGHIEIVRLLLEKKARIIANAEGLTPQALAARAGHSEILALLIAAGADPNVREKGSLWTPLCFAAESGFADSIRILLDAGADSTHKDEKERHAAFYAAWNGKIEALNLLLVAMSSWKDESARKRLQTGSKTAGATVATALGLTDSKSTATKPSPVVEVDDRDLEIDGIPDLSLPPPIIPFRTYGHNYLDKRVLVSVSLSNASLRLYKSHDDATRPEPFASASVKLVMTCRPVLSTPILTPSHTASAASLVHSQTIVLPLADDFEVFSFQVDSPARFALEWELMPTFGSKVIGKAVALPDSLARASKDRTRFALPLQDAYLKLVGEVAFEIDFVRPFDSVQLEIGGRVETYWKSLLPSAAAVAATSTAQRMTPTGGTGATLLPGLGSSIYPKTTAAILSGSSASTVASSGTTTPTTSATPSGAPAQAALVTASSISGEYLRVAVQVTKDGVAVVYPALALGVTVGPASASESGLEVFIANLTVQQFDTIARASGRAVDGAQAAAQCASRVDAWRDRLEGQMVTLEALLDVLPMKIGIDVHILYPSSAKARADPSMPKLDVNHVVDTVLHTVYAAGTASPQISRRIFFSSASPTVCTALNWKQPNYAVFFHSYCGLSPESVDTSGWDPIFTSTPAGSNIEIRASFVPSSRIEPDPRRRSLAEAVRFAKGNNLLGIMVASNLLVSTIAQGSEEVYDLLNGRVMIPQQQVPHLIQSVKSAGLLLISVGAIESTSSARLVVPAFTGKGSSTSSGSQVSGDGADERVDGIVERSIVRC